MTAWSKVHQKAAHVKVMIAWLIAWCLQTAFQPFHVTSNTMSTSSTAKPGTGMMVVTPCVAVETVRLI